VNHRLAPRPNSSLTPPCLLRSGTILRAKLEYKS
jgi:hypothetical protein